MKTNLLFLLASAILLANAHYTNAQSDSTKIKGNVSGIWTMTKSPYFVIGDITVPVNNTLEVRPGVRVIFMGHYKLNINGLLRAIGKPDSMILFDGVTATVKWNGIRFSYAHDSCMVRFCKIQNGSASGSDNSGGGVSIINCSPKLLHNIITSNNATGYGGGIWIIGRSALPILDGNQIINNYAFDGGGVFINDYASPLLTNNIIARNGALSNGDGIYIDYFSTPRIINNTIVDNNRGNHRTSPEGIFLYNTPSPKIINNIIAKHQGCGIVGAVGPNSLLDYNNVWGNNASYCGVSCGMHDISDDPRFVNSDSNYHVQPNSIVIDKGTSGGAPLVDFDGDRRPQGKGVDIGADENIMNIAEPPTTPSLLSPPNVSTVVVPTNLILIWNASSGAGTISYRLQVSIDSCFSDNLIIDRREITDTKFTIGSFFVNRTYFWRISASNQRGTSGWSSIWRFKTIIATPVNERKFNEIPTTFSLSQNYPNPFNPSTTIRYTLPKTAIVNLAVFTSHGETIETLVSGIQVTGEYEIHWSPKNFTSGVYLYRLTVDQFVETKKMILVR